MNIKKTRSICPECHRIIPANVEEKDGKVWLVKVCPEHGESREIYWTDYKMYKRAASCGDGGYGADNFNTKGSSGSCPMNCGLCSCHKSHTLLGNIFLTNRCNLACWYCFANAGAEGFVYEPDFEAVKGMLETLRASKPYPTPAVLLTGGEPTLRTDLLEIIKYAKELGFDHILLNTNGIRIAKDTAYCRQVKDAGAGIIYLSFDGVSSKTNPKNHKYISDIMKNCREAGLCVVLVPTVINGVNDHEAGQIIEFAMENIDVVRGVNFQPVSFVGKMPKVMREKQRVTIPDLVQRIETQTGGRIKKGSFYPVSAAMPFSRLYCNLSGNKGPLFSCHAHCGAGTYVLKGRNGQIISIKDLVNVDSALELIDDIAGEMGKPLDKRKALLKLTAGLPKFIKINKEVIGVDIGNMIKEAILGKDSSFRQFHNKALFIGTMHFQDAYNFDTDRVERCVIHYVTPDKKIIPFCAFNGLPEIYRESIHKKYAMTFEEYKRKTGIDVKSDILHE